MDRPRPPVPGDPLEHVPELLDVAGPARAQQQLHRLGRAGQSRLLAELGQEERHQLLQVLDVMAQRGQFHAAREIAQDLGQVLLGALVAHGDHHPQRLLPLGGPRLLQGTRYGVQLPGAQHVHVPQDQRALAFEQFPAHAHQPVMAGGVGRVQHAEVPGRVLALVHGPDHGELPDPPLALQREPFAAVVGRFHLGAATQPERGRADQAGQEHRLLRAAGVGVPGGGLLDQLDVDDPVGGSSLLGQRPALDPGTGAGGQGDGYRRLAPAGQRLGRVAEHRDLVRRVEHLPGGIVHHHHVGRQRQHDPAGVPAGPQVFLHEPELPGGAVADQVGGDLVGGRLGQRDQQRVGILAPAGQVHRADRLPGQRVIDRHPGAAEDLQVLRVVLVAEHVRGLAPLQGGPDPVRADLLLGVAEARGELDPVQLAFEVAVRRHPAQHHARRVGQDDAYRLAVQVLVQVPQHRHGAAGQRGVEVRVPDIGQLDAVGRDLPVPGPPPRGQDGPADQPGGDGLAREKPLPRLGQSSAAGRGGQGRS